MARYIIQGGKPLLGEAKVSGSKNALNNAGFNNIKFADMDLNEVDNFDVSRLFIICKK